MEHTLAAPSNRTKRRLLIVDRNFSDLRYYSRIFEQEGFEVRSLASYEEATTCLLNERFDLVVVGQVGPEFAAWPVLAQAVQAEPRLPVFVLSHCVDWDCVLQAMRLGAAGIHRKSLSPSKLVELAIKALRPRTVGAGVARFGPSR